MVELAAVPALLASSRFRPWFMYQESGPKKPLRSSAAT